MLWDSGVWLGVGRKGDMGWDGWEDEVRSGEMR